MNYNPFDSKIWKTIEHNLELELSSNPNKPIAAFDADGTLWDIDLGEVFFQHQIKNKLVKLPSNPWEHYHHWKNSGDPRPAYLWLAQINQNQKIEKIRKWAEEGVRAVSPLPIFPDIKKLIDYLLGKKVEVYIVTASVKWAVEPGALRLNIPIENVIGVKTKIKNGIITDEQEGLITYQEGKIDSLLEYTNGRMPFLSVGNSMGDISLLNASKISLAVGAAKPNDELFATEERLRQEAKARDWMIHQF